MIPALVLTAGLATRLRPLSYVRAKAALPVGSEPLARRILRGLRAAGVTDAVLNLHHLPATLTSRLGDGSDIGMRVRYSWEGPVVLGSAGGPRHALSLLGPTFLIVNGDTLTDVDVPALLREHERTGALVTLALIPNTEPQKYGGVTVDGSGAVTGFARRGSAERSYHFIGFQAAAAEVFASLPDNTPHETFRALYPALMAARPGSVRGFLTSASFMDIGTPADYLETALRLGGDDPPRAGVERSILWDDVLIGAGAMLRECIVTDGVHVPADTSWHGVILRRADGVLAPGEKRIGDLAVSAV
ncbi:MAG: sugar phosphate nucleotidyltransferase [Vicinamibacterales bacterium]